ncbi:plasmid pRiA4b ORF-3 family protein [Tessaracoccus flavus]|nr:plasmid pRiA4b ORF-3 family protein [Tessaracoccus flavus]
MAQDGDRQRQIDELADQIIAESGGIDGLLVRLGAHPGMALPTQRQPTLLPPRAERVAYVLRIELEYIEPPIWRQVVVPSDLTLDALHDVLQAAMGWTDSHLHAFRMGPGELEHNIAPFVTQFDIEEGDDGTPEVDVRLDEVLGSLGDRLSYEYDFGDGWEHRIILESIQAEPFTEVRCLAGERACPPEDVGGVPGYERLLDVLAGRAHDVDPAWAQTLRDWAPPGFDPECFDVNEANEALDGIEWPTMEGWRSEVLGLIVRLSVEQPTLVRKLAVAVDRREPISDEQVEEVVADLRLLLERVGSDGIKLTQAGYLPPKVVKELFAGLRPEVLQRYPFQPTTEINTPPVLNLREAAMGVGLVRKYKGVLVLTPKGRTAIEAPEKLWRAVVDGIPVGKRQYEVDAGLIELLGVAGGLDVWRDRETLGDMFAAAGWRSDAPMEWAYRDAASGTRRLLSILGGGATVAAAIIRGS